MASEAAQSAGDLQVQVRFETKLPELYRVPGSTFAVPASLNRYGLSEVVNTLLGTSGRSRLRRFRSVWARVGHHSAPDSAP